MSAREDWTGKRVLIMGLGLFGGGVAAVRYFASRGALVTVTDRRGAEDLAPSLARLEDLAQKPELCLGSHREEDFLAADLVVRSPAVPSSSPLLELARGRGVAVETEMNLLMRRLRAAEVLGITGSNGKTTTTAMTGAILEAAATQGTSGGGRRVWVGGNNGRPLLEHVDEIETADTVCLEMSSFQLEDLHEVGRSPRIGLVTNLTPNHLDRHGSFEAYARAKRAVFEYQGEQDWLVLNTGCAATADWAADAPGRVAWFGAQGDGPKREGVFLGAGGDCVVSTLGGRESDELFRPERLRVPGRHNVENAMAAAAAALLAGAPVEAVAPALEAFSGVPHRLELVAGPGGRRFYNDSIATSPEATAVSLAAVEPPVVLLAGGSDKGLPFEPLGRAAVEGAVAVVVYGATAAAIGEAVEGARGGGPLPEVRRAATLDEAFAVALELVPPGGAVLLAPACASFDQFRNFEERGERFRVLVRNLLD